MYVADSENNRVQKFPSGSDSSTNAVNVAGIGGPGYGADNLIYPTGVYVDHGGNIFVADQGNNRIQKWSQAPTSISIITDIQTISLAPNPKRDILRVPRGPCHGERS